MVMHVYIQVVSLRAPILRDKIIVENQLDETYVFRDREEITLSYECCVIIIPNLSHVDFV